MIDYCSHLLSKQHFLPTLNALAAHFSFHSIIVLDFFVSVFIDISIFVFVNGISLNPFLRISVSVSINVNYTVDCP